MSLLGITDTINNAINAEMHYQDLAYDREKFLSTQEFNHNEAQLAYERALDADSTKYQRQVKDMIKAGLNPMLAAGSSAGTINPSAASSSSGSFPAFPGVRGGADVGQMIQLRLQERMTDAQIANIDADTAKKRAETEGQENENRLFRSTEELRVALVGDEHDRNQWEKEIGLRGVQVKEDNQRMLEQNAQHYNDYLDKQADYIHELSVSEDAKREMYRANARESRQNAAYKAAMLEVDKQAREAATEESREQANLLATEARIKNGIYNEDYIKAVCREANADAELKEILADYKKGNYSKASKNLQKVLKELERKGQIMPIGEAFGESTRAAGTLPALN